MTRDRARIRRRIASEEPQTDPSIKRMYWWGGAVAGVVIGAAVALLAIPPIFDRYFGIADIALGNSYDGAGIQLTVTSAGLAEAHRELVVVLDLANNDGWCPADATFRLELEGRVSIGSATVEPEGCDLAAPYTGALSVSFPAGAHTAEELHILHVDDPKVRFWLQPGEPGE